MSWFDHKVSVASITKDNTRKISNVRFTHKKKLLSLGINQDNELDASSVIFNFSDRFLNTEEKQILKLGLQFGFPSSKVDFVKHYLPFEKLIQQLSKYKSNDEFDEVLSKINFFFSHESYKNKSKNDNNKVNIDVLDSLRKDKSLVITKPDN